MRYRCVTYVLLMCYVCVAYVLLTCYLCVTSVLFMCHLCATDVLPMCYICATKVLLTCYLLCAVLRMCYSCATSVLLIVNRSAQSTEPSKCVRGTPPPPGPAARDTGGRPTEPPARCPDPVAHHPLSGIAAVGSCRCRFSPTHTAHHNGFQHRPTQQAALLHERWPTRKAAFQHAPCPVRSATIP